jgi:hypothetical protein
MLGSGLGETGLPINLWIEWRNPIVMVVVIGERGVGCGENV